MQDDYPTSIDRSRFTCTHCGYDLSGSAVGGRCPECGTAVGDSLRASINTQATGSSSTATTCMVLGIVGITVCGLCGPFAIWLYYSAKAEVERGTAPPSSLGMAKAGLVLGWISTGLMLLACVFYGLLLSVDL